MDQITADTAAADSLAHGGSAKDVPANDMTARAAEASAFMKALAHEGRMMILCHLSGGEKTVSQLEVLLGQRQAAVSQQLARLRSEGLVSCRRDGKARYYAVADPRAAEVVALMYRLFCAR
ncbi:MAG: ArsR/SmtB family transcription factor [Paracoccus sp. (in: a-proteobacteria)]